MPKVQYVEKTIFNIEGVNVDFVKNGANVRGDASLPINYAGRMTKNMVTVSFLKNKLQKLYPGYDFIVYDGGGEIAKGQCLLGNLRDTYLDE